MKNIVITILCILVLGLSGALVYSKVINKDTKKDNNDVSEKAEETVKENNYENNQRVDDSKVEEITINNELYSSIYPFSIADLKLMTGLEAKNINLSDLSDKTVLRIALNSMSGSYGVKVDENGNSIDAEVWYDADGVLHSIEYIFGSDRANKIDLNTVARKEGPASYGDFWISQYNEQSNRIAVTYAPLGPEFIHVTETKALKAEKEGSNLVHLYTSVSVYNSVENQTNTYTIKYTYVKENERYRFDSLKFI